MGGRRRTGRGLNFGASSDNPVKEPGFGAPAPWRIGISPCPNDVFIFSGWMLGRCDAPPAVFDFEDVQTLNLRAAGGGYDLIKVSYAAVPGLLASHRLLEPGGALGHGCGPLLLTGGGAFDFHRLVRVPGEQTTANFLLDFWADGKTLSKEFLPFDRLYSALRSDPGAQGVVIHEARFTYAGDGLHLVADLGEYWEAETGSPIPLGGILARRGSEAASGAGSRAEAAVRSSLAWARSHESEALALCRRYAPEMPESVLRSHIHLYVNDFSLAWGRRGRAAVRSLLGRLGVSDSVLDGSLPPSA